MVEDKLPTRTASEVQGNACLSAVNGYRQKKGLPPYRAYDGKNQCTAGQAANDVVHGWHNAFGKCGEHGQCEAEGTSDCAGAIKMYWDEGPGGGHYDIIMSTRFTTMSWGRSGNFWTHDFFDDAEIDQGAKSITTDAKAGNHMSFMVEDKLPTRTASEVQGNACLSAVNGYRQKKGLPAYSAYDGKDQCTAGQAANDKVHGWHKAFGKCGEYGQCEAEGTSDCAGAIKMYWDEGPGGGHYDIIMSTRFTKMSWGRSGNFWTHDFF
jgi:hypothetical protein